MSRDDDALARRAAREARRAAMRARGPEPDGDVQDEENGDASTVDPIRAAREAARAAAVGAAVGAVRALTSRRDGDEDAEETEDELEEQAVRDEQQRPEHPSRPQEGAELGQVEQVLRHAREQLRQLNGAEPESISSFERTGDGWRVTFEVLELRRIPETTDVLASYAVELDESANLVSYARLRRYQRSEALEASS